ncbi:MAG: hypothetical protein AAB227_09935 [Pseudomonadota bacterium]
MSAALEGAGCTADVSGSPADELSFRRSAHDIHSCLGLPAGFEKSEAAATAGIATQPLRGVFDDMAYLPFARLKRASYKWETMARLQYPQWLQSHCFNVRLACCSATKDE